MNTTKTNPLGWPRRKARAFIEWAMWDRRRFVTVLTIAVAIIAIALTVAITSVALSIQNAVGNSEAQPTTGHTSVSSEPTPTNWATRDMFGNEKVTATTTLPIPPASAGPEAAARNFAEHLLRGAHLKDHSDDRRRWVAELTPLMSPGGNYFLRESRQEDLPIATITNAKTVEQIPGMPRGAMLTTFDLSDASILVVTTQREYGDSALWLVSDWRYKK